MSKEKLKNQTNFHLTGWLWGLLAGTIVFSVFFYLRERNYLSFAKEISIQFDPTNILTVIFTAYLALIVVRQLQRSDEGDKLERELFIENMRSFLSLADKGIHSLTVTTGIDFKTVASTFMNLDMELQETVALASLSSCDNTKNLDLLRLQFSNLRELLQYVPSSEDASDNVVLKDADMFYSSAYLITISKEMMNLKKTIYLIIMQINRS